MPQRTQPQKAVNRPEKKFGPYPGGIGVAVWLNTIQTDNGPRKVRSLTVAPRRYRDPESGEWKDAPSYRPGDLPALIFALQKAQEFCLTEPIPGEEEQAQEPSNGSEDIPY